VLRKLKSGPATTPVSLSQFASLTLQASHDEEKSLTPEIFIGLATQLALAYAIHKSFIFVRIPLTVAVTPRIVKQLRAWGWNIGKKLGKAKR
jgi:hypothetical protein